MYKILRSMVIDNGTKSDACIGDASDDLIRQVEEYENDGWVALGGVQVYARQTRNGMATWLMQSIGKAEGSPAVSRTDDHFGDPTSGAVPSKPRLTTTVSVAPEPARAIATEVPEEKTAKASPATSPVPQSTLVEQPAQN